MKVLHNHVDNADWILTHPEVGKNLNAFKDAIMQQVCISRCNLKLCSSKSVRYNVHSVSGCSLKKRLSCLTSAGWTRLIGPGARHSGELLHTSAHLNVLVAGYQVLEAIVHVWCYSTQGFPAKYHTRTYNQENKKEHYFNCQTQRGVGMGSRFATILWS